MPLHTTGIRQCVLCILAGRHQLATQLRGGWEICTVHALQFDRARSQGFLAGPLTYVNTHNDLRQRMYEVMLGADLDEETACALANSLVNTIAS